MDANLKFFLEQAPTNVKELSRLTGKSQTWVRDALKKDQDTILCRKNEAGQNIFWLGSDEKPIELTFIAEIISAPHHVLHSDEGVEVISAPSHVLYSVEGVCPFCQSADLAPAGAEGSFLGAALVCKSCGKTHNGITGKEVLSTQDKKRRTPLNPQYKINAKTQVAQAAGGKVSFDRADRTWVLETKTGQTRVFSALEFSVLTPEAVVALVG